MDKKLEIRGRTFRTNTDYARAWNDDKIIKQIEKYLDRSNPEQIKELRARLEEGRYRFESIVGDDFIEEIVELDEEFRRNPPIDARDKKGRRSNKRDESTSKNKGDTAGKEAGGKKDKGNRVVRKASKTDFDADVESEAIRLLKRQQIRRRIFMSFLALCIVGSIGYLIMYYALYEKNDVEYEALSDMVKEDTGGTVVINYEEAKDKPPILRKYEALYQKNRKLVGWITIEKCGIDYPVMQTADNEYYLDHNYNQDYDKNGSIFMDKDCTPAFPNDNMIIYGHHMKSGKMFGNLNYYAKQDFWEKNKTFTFDTIYETGKYEVMYVFRDKIHSEDEIVFKYYQFIDATSAEEFDSNMEAMREMSFYDTGVTAAYGDRLITLSTCDSSTADGRFVVVARKMQ